MTRMTLCPCLSSAHNSSGEGCACTRLYYSDKAI